MSRYEISSLLNIHGQVREVDRGDGLRTYGILPQTRQDVRVAVRPIMEKFQMLPSFSQIIIVPEAYFRGQ